MTDMQKFDKLLRDFGIPFCGKTEGTGDTAYQLEKTLNFWFDKEGKFLRITMWDVSI